MRNTDVWRRVKYGFANAPLILGSVLVAALIAIAIFGPSYAPHNPALIDRVQEIDGELGRAPFPPSSLYPLGTDDHGRDILSMILYGASQTLAMAATVTLARVLLGFILGALAGWYREVILDRAITTLAEYLASFPTLILGIALIYALGIRRGQSTFVIALCLIGWPEIAQSIRSQVMVLKEKPFIEGARAVGLRELDIIVRHVLPNLLPSLLALAALEMGAVLLILGELGFVGVFVGGGTWDKPTDIGMPLLHFFDVPEWGAMLSNSWKWIRSYYWMALYPALALFISILAFNLLGIGLQRLIERVGFGITTLSLKKFAVLMVSLFLATRFLLQHTGPVAHYTQLAKRFDASRAMKDIEMLCSEAMEGRRFGTQGEEAAAVYIADQFRKAGLQPAPVELKASYHQAFTKTKYELSELPRLSIINEQGRVLDDFVYRDDFAEHSRSGSGVDVEGEVMALDHLHSRMAMKDKILLLPHDVDPFWVRRSRVAGVLTIAPDELPIRQRKLIYSDFTKFPAAFPWFYITEEVADRLLHETALTSTETSTAAPTPTLTPTLEPETGAIEGNVFLQGRFDHSGASILINGVSMGTTGSDGHFLIVKVPTGTHIVTASMPGYLSSRLTDVVVKASETTELPHPTLIGGDANNDKAINLYDLVIVGAAYGTTPPTDPQADINDDGVVNIFDLVLVGTNYGKTGPTSWPSGVSSTISSEMQELAQETPSSTQAADERYVGHGQGEKINVRMRMHCPLDIEKGVTGINVLGYMPGSDISQSRQVVIVSAHYYGGGYDPDGTPLPGANDNASGVAIMLEIARLWHEQGFEPKKSVLFAAWSEGGAQHYANHPIFPDFWYGREAIAAVLQLDSLGSGEGGSLVVAEQGAYGLGTVAQSSAGRLGIRTILPKWDFPFYFTPEQYPTLAFTWPGAKAMSLTPEDTVDKIDPGKLEAVGKVAALTLMTLSAGPD